MYEWLGKPFGRTVFTHHAMWVNHTETCCRSKGDLFTGVRGREILRTSPQRRSEKFATAGNHQATPKIRNMRDVPPSSGV
jgi:hypothetical protein